jgi:hypothetical protein
MNIFENATRTKLKFDTVKGEIGVYELWDVPLTARNGFSINDIGKQVNSKLKEMEVGEFVSKSTRASSDKIRLQLSLEILQHVRDAKLVEEEKLKQARANKERRELLLKIREQKQNQQFDNLTLEQIDDLLASGGTDA